MKKYYLYRHIRKDKNEVFYIGIGTGNSNYKSPKSFYARAYSKTQRNVYWYNITTISNFEVDIILESDDKDFIKLKEIEFIALYKRKQDGGTLCNMTLGGEGANGLKGVPKPAGFSETLSKRSLGNKYGLGKVCSEEKKSKISQSNKERFLRFTEQEKVDYAVRMSRIKKGVKQKPCNYTQKWYTKKEKEKVKVCQFTLDGKFIEEFNSLTEAASSNIKFRISKISSCCNKKNKTHEKYIWKFSSEVSDEERQNIV